jgi:hypothetical protein
MVEIKRLVLDVLKPHHPDGLESSAATSPPAAVREVDENTETLQLVVEGESLDFERLRAAIGEMGASLHSIDEVEVVGGADGEG